MPVIQAPLVDEVEDRFSKFRFASEAYVPETAPAEAMAFAFVEVEN